MSIKTHAKIAAKVEVFSAAMHDAIFNYHRCKFICRIYTDILTNITANRTISTQPIPHGITREIMQEIVETYLCHNKIMLSYAEDAHDHFVLTWHAADAAAIAAYIDASCSDSNWLFSMQKRL